ncbi:tRNA (cytidine(34)-2'-O)-methyltransferase [Mycoplasmatota bacterium]|nr:tRNA (cytidine(34)-2'-O)-methyltransferase [Mycoplasmatota bacterium]
MINVVLYNPEIPHNTGNIMRTCVATNVRLHLIEPLGFSLDEKSVRRSGASYVNKTNYSIYSNWEDFVKKNKGKYYFSTRYGSHLPNDYDFSNTNDNIYLIFGAESSGIPKRILANHLENCIRLPMTKDVRSLNLSNVVAIMVYEVLRQQNYNDLYFEEPEELKGKDYLLL